jgi:predicted TIM-barrel fold metal-dependent hydrolase
MNRLISRREILAAGAAVSLSARHLVAEEKSVPIIDTHLHCFAGNDDRRFPYHADAPYRPPAAATPEHLLQRMREADVDYAIVVHPEPYQDDHRYLEHCLNVGKGKLKGTCLFFAHRADALPRLKELAKKSPLVAARIHAYAPERLPPFGKPELRTLWKQIVELGLAVQLHFEPRYAVGFEPLIREFKDATVLVDHLGRPFQGTPVEYDKVVKWADYPNVIMKLSAVPESTTYPHRDVRPVLKRLLKAFGPSRLMYGGGYSADATGASYRAVRVRLLESLSELRSEEQHQILGGNAQKLFRLG